MAYQRKTRDEFDVEGHYGEGWEIVTCEPTWQGARARIKEYRENEGGRYRIKPRRVPLDA
jgi:hypothetical protein